MIELLNCDCVEYMSGLPAAAFDLAIVDPPYGIGETWNKDKRNLHKGKTKSYRNKQIPDKQYFDQLFRVSKNQIIWGFNYYSHYIPMTNNIIVWDKDLIYEKANKSEGELAWTSIKRFPLRIYKHQWNGALKGSENGKFNGIHPHQKPVKLYRWLLKMYAHPGQRILDTHGGSMSSAIACHQMGFDAVICELDPEYYQAAVKRLNNAKMQQQLF